MKNYQTKHDGSFVINPAFDKVIESESYYKVASIIAYYYQEQYIKLYEQKTKTMLLLKMIDKTNFMIL